MRLKVSNVCQVFNKEEFISTTTRGGITFTNNGDGSFTINGTATANAFIELFKSGTDITGFNINHKYLICGNLSDTIQVFETLSGNGARHYEDSIFTCVRSKGYLDLRINVGTTATNYIFRPQLFDLTEMYGAGNEPTTVEQFRQDFPNEMYEYSPECWKRFRRLKYVTETKNLLSDIIVPTNSSGVSYDEKSGIFTILSNDKAAVVFSQAVMNFVTPLPAGTVITVSIYCISGRYSATGNHTAVGGYHKYAGPTDLASWQGVVSLPRNTDLSGKTFTTTWTVTRQLDAFWIYVPRQTDIIEEDIKFRAQLELGSTASPYQPYGYLPLNRGKYIANKEPVQLLDKNKFSATQITSGVTFTNNSDGTITVNGTNTGEIYYSLEVLTSIPVEHKVIIDDRNSTLYFFGDMRTKDNVLIGTVPPRTIFTLPSNLAKLNMSYFVRYNTGAITYNNELSKPQLFDLTAMYGAGNEPTTVAQFRADFPNELYDYNPYNAITFR